MSEPNNEDQIPTLNKRLVPKNTEKQLFTRIFPDDRQDPQFNTDTKSKSAFEITIEAMVTEILNRHMEIARKEITQKVVEEVRARLPGRNKPR